MADILVTPDVTILNLSSPDTNSFGQAIHVDSITSLVIGVPNVTVNVGFVVYPTRVSIDISSPEALSFSPAIYTDEVTNLTITANEVILPTIAVSTTDLSINSADAIVNLDYTIIDTTVSLNISVPETTASFNYVHVADKIEINISASEIAEMPLISIGLIPLTFTVPSPEVQEGYVVILNDIVNLDITALEPTIHAEQINPIDVISTTITVNDVAVILGVIHSDDISPIVVTSANADIILDYVNDSGNNSITLTVPDPVVLLGVVISDEITSINITAKEPIIAPVVNMTYIDTGVSLDITSSEITWFAAVHITDSHNSLTVEVKEPETFQDHRISVDTIDMSVVPLESTARGSITIFDDVDETNLINTIGISVNDPTITCSYKTIYLRAKVKRLKPQLMEFKVA